jgi:formiminoglutamase
MSGESSNVAAWFSLLENEWPVASGQRPEPRPDDPRLGEIVDFWNGDLAALQPGRGVIVGFPQDEGVRRNHGRRGAAAAPNEIRRFLYRLTPWDGFRDIDLRGKPPLDAGNVLIKGTLEESQQALGKVVAGILTAGAVPIILGGGHETAFGHFLGYTEHFSNRSDPMELFCDEDGQVLLPDESELAGAIMELFCDEGGKVMGRLLRRLPIINIDAHLDVRPLTAEGGHSGSPFRQAMERHAKYVCLGAQPHAVSREHLNFLAERGGVVRWCDQIRGKLCEELANQLERQGQEWVYISIDADAVTVADVPGVSAPNPFGFSGSEVLSAAFLAGQSANVSSLDLVEINPALDRDGQSSRWGALLIWHFLIGLAKREK